MPVGRGFCYPPQIFTDPEVAANVTHTEEEDKGEELNNVERNNDSKFVGDYCAKCKECGEIRCWCITSDWGED